MMPLKIGLKEAIQQLDLQQGNPFTLLAQYGTMSIEYFAPKQKDIQTPHRQDEIYVIAGGQSVFCRAAEKVHCVTGDVLFVPAGMEHHFENFSDDFATWVIFYGIEGGEKSQAP